MSFIICAGHEYNLEPNTFSQQKFVLDSNESCKNRDWDMRFTADDGDNERDRGTKIEMRICRQRRRCFGLLVVENGVVRTVQRNTWLGSHPRTANAKVCL